MAEQARSSGRYRESGQNGLEELVIGGYGRDRHQIVLKNGLWGGKLSHGRRSAREPYPLLIRQHPQPGAKRRQAPGTYPTGAEREGYLPKSARL